MMSQDEEFKKLLQKEAAEANEQELKLFESATSVSLSEVDGTYTGTAPVPKRHPEDADEEKRLKEKDPEPFPRGNPQKGDHK